MDDFATPYYRPRRSAFSTVCLYLALFSICAGTTMGAVAMARNAAQTVKTTEIREINCKFCHVPKLDTYGAYRKYWRSVNVH